MRARIFTQSFKEGDDAETRFTLLAEFKGYIVEKSSNSQNMRSHIDVFITKDPAKLKENTEYKPITYSIDIKGLKRVNRGDILTENEKIWIELKNVQGRKGWLYGEADIIAFEMNSGFLLVLRKSLLDFVEKMVDINDPVTKSSEALYKVYTRKDRKDVISLVNLSDMRKETKNKFWPKINE